EIVLLVDTFNRYFEPDNAVAAERVLSRAGYRVTTPEPAVGRPLCCGRTFLAAGLINEARQEARRMLDALAPAVAAGTPIVGMEAEHYDMSLKIGELGVLPKMRAAAPNTMLAACGTSCRHQIADVARRDARHIVRILDDASA